MSLHFSIIGMLIFNMVAIMAGSATVLQDKSLLVGLMVRRRWLSFDLSEDGGCLAEALGKQFF
jgi:hypothetical protein